MNNEYKYIAFTGHSNIEKMCNLPLIENGDRYNPEAYRTIASLLIEEIFHNVILRNENEAHTGLCFISGMARGIDEIIAHIAIKFNIPLILCVPHSVAWHKSRQPSRGIRAQAIAYDKILEYNKLLKIHEVKKNEYPNEKYVNMARNQKMVDISHIVFSVKDYASSGTDDCIKRAVLADKYGGNLWESF